MKHPRRKAGHKLREIRKHLGLTLRDVHKLTEGLASSKRNPKFIIRPSRLSEIEVKGVIPTIHRLCSLCCAYRVPLQELLAIYDLEEFVTETGGRTARAAIAPSTFG
jgi:transcriptional regulator with XRE-family HTH domain